MTAPDSPGPVLSDKALDDPDYANEGVPQPEDSDPGHVMATDQWAAVEADQLYHASNFASDPTLSDDDVPLITDMADLHPGGYDPENMADGDPVTITQTADLWPGGYNPDGAAEGDPVDINQTAELHPGGASADGDA